MSEDVMKDLPMTDTAQAAIAEARAKGPTEAPAAPAVEAAPAAPAVDAEKATTVASPSAPQVAKDTGPVTDTSKPGELTVAAGQDGKVSLSVKTN